MILKYFNLKIILHKFLSLSLIWCFTTNTLIARPINPDFKISIEIEDAIISSNPQKLIKLLSKTYLTQDEKKYDLNLAKYLSYKANIEVTKASLVTPKLLFGFFCFASGSLFANHNLKIMKEKISDNEKLFYRSGIFYGVIVSFIGLEKIYKVFTKYKEKRKRNNAYAIETLIKNAKNDEFEND